MEGERIDTMVLHTDHIEMKASATLTSKGNQVELPTTVTLDLSRKPIGNFTRNFAK